MSDQPHLLVEQSGSKLDDESGRALLAESPLEPVTSNSRFADPLLSSPGLSEQSTRPQRKQVKLPPINSSASSPQPLPLKKSSHSFYVYSYNCKELGKKAALANVNASLVKPAELFEVNNILKMNAFVNWEKLRDYVFAHRVTGK